MEVIYQSIPGNIETIVACVGDHKDGSPVYHYGTAGFRDKGTELFTVAPRIGIIAALRSLSVQNKPVGIMITASHNHVDDNGFKIIDHCGGMLAMNWEGVATDITNAGSDTLGAAIQKNLDENKTKLPTHDNTQTEPRVTITQHSDQHFGILSSMPTRPVIILGYDTRPTSLPLYKRISATCLQMGAIVINYGMVTTPQLHWVVGRMNEQIFEAAKGKIKHLTSIDDYTRTVSKSFIELYSLFDHFSIKKGRSVQNKPEERDVIYVDCAYGVGALAFGPVGEYIQTHSSSDSQLPLIKPVLVPADDKPVNASAGIDYALKNKGSGLDARLMEILSEEAKAKTHQTMLFSVDGDCDRLGGIVPADGGKAATFLDGDRLLVLFTQFLSTLIDFYQLSDYIDIRIVQTAYCNGASTHYLKENHPHVQLLKACTGVKYLLEKTKEGDLSVYFEQNGHGSVHFNKTLFQKLEILVGSEDSQLAANAKEFENLMKLCRDVITPYIGDACGDMLFALVAMKALHLDMVTCYATYTDLFTTQCVVAVADKSSIKPDRGLFEERLLEPIELQHDIDELMTKYAQYQPRAFVRPSGTENVVRTFAESTCPTKTEEMSAKLKEMVTKYGGAKL